jgi:DMSO reductase anchor subunit
MVEGFFRSDAQRGGPDVNIGNAVPQQVWGWAAAANLTLGGLGAAFHLSVLMAGGGRPDLPLAPLLVMAGFLIQAAETGRPLQGARVLARVWKGGGSWMSREVLLGMVFIAASLGDWRFAHVGLTMTSALAAAGFLLAQGLLVARAKAVEAWNRPSVPLLLGTLSLLTGSGLLLSFGKPADGPVHGPAVLALAVLLTSAAVWKLHEAEGTRKKGSTTTLAVLGFHALAVVMGVTIALGGGGRILELATGTVMIGCGALLKVRVLKTGKLRPLSLTSVEYGVDERVRCAGR